MLLLLMIAAAASGQSSAFVEYQKRKAMLDSAKEITDGQTISSLPGKRMSPIEVKLLTGNIHDPLLDFHSISILGKKLIDGRFLCVFVRCKPGAGESEIQCLVFRFDYNPIFQAVWFVDGYLLGSESIPMKVDGSAISIKGKSAETWKFNARGKLTKNGE